MNTLNADRSSGQAVITVFAECHDLCDNFYKVHMELCEIAKAKHS